MGTLVAYCLGVVNGIEALLAQATAHSGALAVLAARTALWLPVWIALLGLDLAHALFALASAGT